MFKVGDRLKCIDRIDALDANRHMFLHSRDIFIMEKICSNDPTCILVEGFKDIVSVLRFKLIRGKIRDLPEWF